MLDMARRTGGLRGLRGLHGRARGGVRDPRSRRRRSLAQRFEELRDAAQEDEVLADVRGRRADRVGDRDPLRARARTSPTPRPASARRATRLFALAADSGALLARHRHASVEPVAGAADHRHRALPPRGGGPAVRGVAQQHLQPPRARGGPRRRPRDRGVRPAAADPARSCWRSRPTRRSSTAATRGCTRRARQIFTKSFPRCGIPDAVRELRRLRGLRRLPGADRTRSSSTPSCGGACGRTTASAPSRSGSATPSRSARGVHRAGGADRGLRRPGGARLRRGGGLRATRRGG